MLSRHKWFDSNTVVFHLETTTKSLRTKASNFVWIRFDILKHFSNPRKVLFNFIKRTVFTFSPKTGFLTRKAIFEEICLSKFGGRTFMWKVKVWNSFNLLMFISKLLIENIFALFCIKRTFYCHVVFPGIILMILWRHKIRVSLLSDSHCHELDFKFYKR